MKISAGLSLYEGFSDLPGSRQQYLRISIELPGIPRPGDEVTIVDGDQRVKYVMWTAGSDTVAIEFERVFAGHDGYEETLAQFHADGWA